MYSNPDMSNSDLSNASEKISNMVDRLNLPRTIVDRANRLLESMYERQNLKSQFSDTMASACVYIICRSVL
jgi:transcription initiation factor TFIIIB Brf1 subunit/transcription initiation factor TFIIB